MKILTEQNTAQVLQKIDRNAILNVYQPQLIQSLVSLQKNPGIIPPRIVQSSNTESSDSTHLFMPCVGDGEVGLKVITGGPTNSKQGKGFVGCILVLDENDGSLQGVLNARIITGFRTALASSIPFVHIMESDHGLQVLDTITVLGSGIQAFWHVKLALQLYGDRFKNVNIINRSLDGASKLRDNLAEQFPSVKYSVFSYQEESHKESIKVGLQSSSVIFGCLPTTEPVIIRECLNPDPKVLKYINLIGSYKPHMSELDPRVIEDQFTDTLIIVDSKEHALHEAGELVNRNPDHVIELCDLNSVETSKLISKNGIVLSKLVGVSVMDLCISKLVLAAASSDIGLSIEDF